MKLTLKFLPILFSIFATNSNAGVMKISGEGVVVSLPDFYAVSINVQTKCFKTIEQAQLTVADAEVLIDKHLIERNGEPFDKIQRSEYQFFNKEGVYTNSGRKCTETWEITKTFDVILPNMQAILDLRNQLNLVNQNSNDFDIVKISIAKIYPQLKVATQKQLLIKLRENALQNAMNGYELLKSNYNLSETFTVTDVSRPIGLRTDTIEINNSIDDVITLTKSNSNTQDLNSQNIRMLLALKANFYFLIEFRENFELAQTNSY